MIESMSFYECFLLIYIKTTFPKESTHKSKRKASLILELSYFANSMEKAKIRFLRVLKILPFIIMHYTFLKLRA